LIGRRNTPTGTRMPINELVFFGRLEARKGLFTFCQAIRRLMREGVKLPPKISFMGKPGAKLPGRAHQSVIEYIEAETANWPAEVQILTEFQQQQAIEYLLGDARLAIMPSAIENSSMAVYEAAICGIPFIGSGVGGSPELVLPQDHAHVFCDPHPIPLAEQIKVAIAEGGYVATPSFDNDENVAVWKRFHADLAKGLRQTLCQQGQAEHGERASTATVAVCIYHSGNTDALRQTLQTLEAQSAKPDEILIAVDAPNAGAVADAQAVTAACSLPCRLVETFDEDVGLSFNSLADAASSDHALFVWEGTTLDPQALSVLRKVMMLSNADVLNFFYRHIDPAQPPQGDAPHPLKAIVIGSVSEAFFRKEITAQPLFVKRAAFRKIGGFSTDYRVLGYDSEFLAKAQLSGLQCETALMELATVPAFAKEWLHELCYDEGLSQFRAIRPQLAAAPLALRDLLLMAKGMSARGGAAAPKKRVEAAKPATNFERMLSAFSAEVIEVTPKPRPEPQKAAKPARAAQRRSVVSLIDVLEQTLGEETRDPEAKPAPRKKTGAKAENTAYEIPVPAREPLERRLFYVHEGAVYGAVFDRNQPGRTLVVEALKDGKVIATTAADMTHAMPQRAHRPEFDGHGFVLQPFSKWMPQSFNRGSVVLDLRVAGENVMIARDLRIYGPGATMAGTPFDGYCEPSREGLVQGWVWLESDPDRRMDVAIFVDGKFAIRLRADTYREDLVQNQIGSGEHAFRIAVDKLVPDREPHVVDVVIAQNGLRLKRAPLLVAGRNVDVGASGGFPLGQRARAALNGMFGG
jgi:hypothetical protein